MRKTDRRTLYTEQAIKDALLQCCKSTSYRDVTITDVCRTAEINRGTFYRHYRNLPEVLDEILDDVTDQLADLDEQWEGAKATESCGIPLCQFIRQETKYRPLFLDEALCPALLRELGALQNVDHLWTALPRPPAGARENLPQKRGAPGGQLALRRGNGRTELLPAEWMPLRRSQQSSPERSSLEPHKMCSGPVYPERI